MRLAASLLLAAACAVSAPAADGALRSALTFHAGFDGQADADFALGDRKLYSAPSMNQPRAGQPGLPASGFVTLAPKEGKFGDALRFHKKAREIVFFQGLKNINYRTQQWSGTVSFWLKLNPDEDLEPGFSDPVQITPRDWNDAAFFVEFGKDEKPRHFRLGAYADFKVWNPANREWNTIPFVEKPLAGVAQPPFSRERWTHVAFTFNNFNTGKKDGLAQLYLNGQLEGAIGEREQTFTWDPAQAKIMLGLSYIGLFDDLAIFNRALTESEIEKLRQLETGVKELHPQP